MLGPERVVTGVLGRELLEVADGAAAAELVAATLDRGERLLQHDLEVGQLGVDVVVDLAPHGPRLVGSLLPDPGRLTLRLGVSLAVGLTVVTMAYAIGHISGSHLNPAVTLGLVAGGRHSAKEALPYIVAQTIGGAAGALVLYVIASGKPGFEIGGFAANGFDEHSPGGYGLVAAFVAEVVLTAFFLIIIMGSTDKRAPAGFAPIAIGLALTLIHLIGIPVTNLSVNPARSTGPALVVGGWALAQLWLFWVAPLLGGAIGGSTYKALFETSDASSPKEAPRAVQVPG